MFCTLATLFGGLGFLLTSGPHPINRTKGPIMFILDFLAFIAFDFWYNLIAIVVFGVISVIFMDANQNIGGWCGLIAFGFGCIEFWNIMVWFHSVLHISSMG